MTRIRRFLYILPGALIFVSMLLAYRWFLFGPECGVRLKLVSQTNDAFGSRYAVFRIENEGTSAAITASGMYFQTAGHWRPEWMPRSAIFGPRDLFMRLPAKELEPGQHFNATFVLPFDDS